MKQSETSMQKKKKYNAAYVKRTNAAAQKKWLEKNSERKKTKLLYLWLPRDGDVIEHLANIDNFCEYVKNLIRADMALNAQNNDE